MRGGELAPADERRARAIEAEDCIRRGYVVEAFALLTDPCRPIVEGALALELLRLAAERMERRHVR